MFVTRPDGTGTVHVPLSYPVEDFGLPVWSPDGDRLLITHVFRFDGNGDFLPFRPVIVRPDGSNETLLEIPRWAVRYVLRDMGIGRRLICAFGDDADGVYTVRASDGGDARLLWTNAAGQRDVPFDLAPTGADFCSSGSGRDRRPRRNRSDRTGRAVRREHRWLWSPPDRALGIAHGHELAAAHWSPDGRRSSRRPPRDSCLSHPWIGRGSRRSSSTPADPLLCLRARLVTGRLQIVFAMSVDGQEDLYTANAMAQRDPDHGHARVRERSGLGP